MTGMDETKKTTPGTDAKPPTKVKMTIIKFDSLDNIPFDGSWSFDRETIVPRLQKNRCPNFDPNEPSTWLVVGMIDVAPNGTSYDGQALPLGFAYTSNLIEEFLRKCDPPFDASHKFLWFPYTYTWRGEKKDISSLGRIIIDEQRRWKKMLRQEGLEYRAPVKRESAAHALSGETPENPSDDEHSAVESNKPSSAATKRSRATTKGPKSFKSKFNVDTSESSTEDSDLDDLMHGIFASTQHRQKTEEKHSARKHKVAALKAKVATLENELSEEKDAHEESKRQNKAQSKEIIRLEKKVEKYKSLIETWKEENGKGSGSRFNAEKSSAKRSAEDEVDGRSPKKGKFGLKMSDFDD